MTSFPAQLDRGTSYPLGATWDGLGTNFAVFSAHAERVQLCLFDPNGRREIAALIYRNAPTKFGTAICPTRGPGRFTVTARTDRIVRRMATGSIRTSS